MSEKINKNIPQKLLFKAGVKEIADDLVVSQPEYQGNKRAAKKAARIVATEAANPTEVRRAGANRLVNRGLAAIAIGAIGAGGLFIANRAFEESPSFKVHQEGSAGEMTPTTEIAELPPLDQQNLPVQPSAKQELPQSQLQGKIGSGVSG